MNTDGNLDAINREVEAQERADEQLDTGMYCPDCDEDFDETEDLCPNCERELYEL